MAPLGAAGSAEEIEVLRQQVDELLAQNRSLQTDLSKMRSERITSASAETEGDGTDKEAGGLQKTVAAALQPEQDVEVVRLEVVRRKGSAPSVPPSPPGEVACQQPPQRPVSIEGPVPRSKLAWCCQAHQPALPLDDDPALQRDDDSEMKYESLPTGPIARTQRTADTMLLGARLHFSVRSLQKELDNAPGLDEDEIQERWDVLHRRNSSLVLDHIMHYRGFFIKIGQKASTMKAVLPDVWVETLEPLQDKVPITPLSAVRQTISEDLGRSFDEVFSRFEGKPIGSASIGQAHVAWLRGTDEKVCVKVEHPGIAELSGVDLANIDYLVRMMCKIHEEAPDISEMIKEMRRSSLEEVDFTLEAKNAADAHACLQRANSEVGCSEPILAYCGPRVLTMKFVEGWKITETERLPPGTDREKLAAQIVEAWALLVFEGGVVHGDPHPGNIFVEQRGEGPNGLRPVLLDWGMVKRVSPEERLALAKWVVASLSRDRFLYLATLIEMGVNIGGAADLEALDMFMFTGMLTLRDSIPASSMRQFREQVQKTREMDKESKVKKIEAEGKKVQKLVEKIPGWVHFFFKGLGLLQDVCGMLDVTVPVARTMLKYALPRLDIPAEPIPRGLVEVGQGELVWAVRGKLEELGSQNVLGAQVAVLRGGRGEPTCWECDLATGRTALGGPGVTTDTLMPLLDVGLGVLVACLLATLSKPTVTGKEIGLATPVERLWPEFSRSGKSGTTVRQLLQRQAGLAKPFKAKTTPKNFCSENQMEESVAACSRDTGSDDASAVVSIAAAALLRRATGHKNIGASLKAVLEPLGLQEDLVYNGDAKRMASAGHRMLEEVAMSTIWEILEDQMHRKEREMENESRKKAPPFISWQELALEQPWCTDPLFVNSEDLRLGKGCSAGRGMRGTARALCQLLASDTLPQSMLEQSLSSPRRLRVASLEEWEDLGCCLDVAVGWQLLKFKEVESGKEVLGYGHVDGTTGSVALRVPGASVAVLLSCVDKDARHAGRELLSLVAAHLGLAPIWQQEPPKGLPGRGSQLDGAGASATSSGPAGGSVEQAVMRLEAQVARLAEAMGSQGALGKDGVQASPLQPSSDLVGQWSSAEVEGLEELLDVLNVPAMARAFAKRMRRTLRIEVSGDQVSIATTTTVAGKQVEDTSNSFRMGEPFETQQMGNTCKGVARWEEGHDGPEVEARILVIEKSFEVMGNEVKLQERYEPAAGNRLALRSLVHGRGEVTVPLANEADLATLSRHLDAKTLRLKAEVQLGDVQLWRGGKLVGPAWVNSLQALSQLELPGSVVLFYESFRGTMMFDPEGGQRVRGQPSAAAAPRGWQSGSGRGWQASSGRHQGLEASALQERRRRRGCMRGCFGGLAGCFHSLGACLEAACEEERARPVPLSPTPKRQPSKQDNPSPLADSFQSALRLTRTLSGQVQLGREQTQ